MRLRSFLAQSNCQLLWKQWVLWQSVALFLFVSARTGQGEIFVVASLCEERYLHMLKSGKGLPSVHCWWNCIFWGYWILFCSKMLFLMCCFEPAMKGLNSGSLFLCPVMIWIHRKFVIQCLWHVPDAFLLPHSEFLWTCDWGTEFRQLRGVGCLIPEIK